MVTGPSAPWALTGLDLFDFSKIALLSWVSGQPPGGVYTLWACCLLFPPFYMFTFNFVQVVQKHTVSRSPLYACLCMRACPKPSCCAIQTVASFYSEREDSFEDGIFSCAIPISSLLDSHLLGHFWLTVIFFVTVLEAYASVGFPLWQF